MKLRINEIFYSIQGETSYMGRPCIFIRTSGCNLNCHWCDTRYANEEPGELIAPELIPTQIEPFNCRLVSLTGGEPLLQAPTVAHLMNILLHLSYTVLLETNGSLSLSPIPAEIIKIIDIKPPSSGESGSFLEENWTYINPRQDQLKFLIADEKDWSYALDFIRSQTHQLPAEILFSPVQGRLEPALLAEWMLRDHVSGRLQLQLHRIIWPLQTRGV